LCYIPHPYVSVNRFDVFVFLVFLRERRLLSTFERPPSLKNHAAETWGNTELAGGTQYAIMGAS
jgi:hypothetical protein